jgi:signal transduction histidine kinase
MLNEERTVILKRWQERARTQLWHVERGHLAHDGAITLCIDRLIVTLINYLDVQGDAPDSEQDGAVISALPAHSAGEQPAPSQESRAAEEAASRSVSRLASAFSQPDVQDCARRTAQLSLAWSDVRTLLNLLTAVVLETLVAHDADPITNELAAAFLEAFAALAADRRITRMEQDLAAHQEEAVVTQHLAGRFLANASHELRTPLTAVLGFAELLQEENYGSLNPEQATAVGHIENSAQNLLEIVNNLLDLLNIRAGKLTLQYRPINLMSLLEHLYMILIPLAGRKSVQFEIGRGADLGMMEADENIVRHIVYYLLSSALRATPAGGRVTLRAWRDTDNAVIEVQDTALHLPPEAVANMADPFPRLENSPARGYEGWEVGLPLVHRYVDLHHGSLKFESLPTQGTVFRVTLPLKRGKLRVQTL